MPHSTLQSSPPHPQNYGGRYGFESPYTPACEEARGQTVRLSGDVTLRRFRGSSDRMGVRLGSGGHARRRRMVRSRAPWAVILGSGIGAALILSAWLSETPRVPSTTVPTAEPSLRTTSPPAANGLIAAGDIAGCRWDTDEQTAALVAELPGTVAILGDAVYPHGSARLYAECYDSSWGRFRDRTHPVPGDRDYWDGAAAGYFDYFGESAGRAGEGYYSYALADWRVYALNSNCEFVSCGPGSPQYEWLAADLAEHPSSCIVAYWHYPRFSLGAGSTTREAVAPFVELLYRAGADIILSGKVHNYQRLAPLNPMGEVDEDFGIRHFVVGTGGAGLRELGDPVPGTEVRNDTAHGVLRLALEPGSYEWEFIPIDGEFSDSGRQTCHGPPGD